MKKIKPQFSQIVYKGLEINILVEPKFIGYSFHYEGNNYGSKVPLKTTKKQELLENSFALCIQAILSYEAMLNKQEITKEEEVVLPTPEEEELDNQ